MFDPRIQKTNDHIPILEPVTTSNYSYNSYKLPKYTTQTLQNLRHRSKNDIGGVQFRVHNMLHHDESGITSPPLWKNSPPTSPDHLQQNSTNHRSLSPNSRALAIAQGQWELMQMVKNMPESCYELSLKDLVEQHRVSESDQESCLIHKEENHHSSTASPEHVVVQKVNIIQRQESNSSIKNKHSINKGKMIRSESFEDRRLFLKMFFPISLESKKKQKNAIKTTSITKVSPKPDVSDKSSKNLEKDWWKRRFYTSSESDSSRTGSSNSESTDRSGSSGSNGSTRNGNRKKTGFLTSCWSRSCFSKSKSAE